ncbi:MAG: ATP-binding cassette domain-containing protein, partial [Methanomassiliicoccales archaeon]
MTDSRTAVWRLCIKFWGKIVLNAIEVTNLVKAYGKFFAVKGISFTVKQGEIFGLIGPNGAGKTTTLRILATLLQISSG